MTILELAMAIFGVVGSAASIGTGMADAVQALKKSTVEDLFYDCFSRAVKRNSYKFSDLLPNIKSLGVDKYNFRRSLEEVKKLDLSLINPNNKEASLSHLCPTFRPSLTLPNNVENAQIDQYLVLILDNALADFYNELPLKDTAFKELLLSLTLKEHHDLEAIKTSQVQTENTSLLSGYK